MKTAILNKVKKLTNKDYRLQHDSTGIVLVHTPILMKYGGRKYEVTNTTEVTEITAREWPGLMKMEVKI